MRTLLASGAGAGLAVAFNAPIAGAIFVLEELVRRLETRIAIAALGASSTAILVSRLFLGDAPDFQVTVSAQAAANATGPLPYAVAATWPLYLVLGVVAGAAASLYNRAILGAMSLAARLESALAGRNPGSGDRRASRDHRVVCAGADRRRRRHHPAFAGGRVCASLRCRSPCSCASVWVRRVMQCARRAGCSRHYWWSARSSGCCSARSRKPPFPGLGIEPEAFAVVGMAAFFTGVVQSPVTGIVLVTEMTAAFTTLLPMLAACFAAIVTANLLRTPPIYDSLRERLAKQTRSQP